MRLREWLPFDNFVPALTVVGNAERRTWIGGNILCLVIRGDMSKLLLSGDQRNCCSMFFPPRIWDLLLSWGCSIRFSNYEYTDSGKIIIGYM